jgi:hypothetical protein
MRGKPVPDGRTVTRLAAGLSAAFGQLLCCNSTWAQQNPLLYLWAYPGQPEQSLGLQGSFTATGARVQSPDFRWIYSFDAGDKWSDVSFAGRRPMGAIEAYPSDYNGGRIPLEQGLNRVAAAYFGGPKFPLLNVNYTGSGCNDGLSAFYVHESEADANGMPTKLAFDFSFRCEGGYAPPVVGAFRLNSTVPLVVEQAVAVADHERAVLSGAPVVVSGQYSWSMNSRIVSFTWRQIDGPAIDLTDCAQSRCVFAAPIVPPGGKDATLELTVQDEAGRTASDRLKLHIRHRGDRQSQLKLTGTHNSPNNWLLDYHSWLYYSEYEGAFSVMANEQKPDQLVFDFGTADDNHTYTQLLRTGSGAPLGTGTYVATKQGEFDIDRPWLLLSYNHHSPTGDKGDPVTVHALDRDANDLSQIRAMGIHTVSNYVSVEEMQARIDAWVNHQPPYTPTAVVSAPGFVSPGQTFVIDALSSSTPSGGSLNFQVFKTKGPRLELVDTPMPGRWTVRVADDAVIGSKLQIAIEVGLHRRRPAAASPAARHAPGSCASSTSAGSSQGCSARLKVPQCMGRKGPPPSSCQAFSALSGPRWMSPQDGWKAPTSSITRSNGPRRSRMWRIRS